jgi:hypothetical protein
VRALLDAAPVDASRVRAVVSEVIAGRGGDPAGVVARTGVPLLTDPPFSPAGVGLFAARALEALTPERPTRLLVAYGYPEGSPALGLKVQAELSQAAVAAVAERVVIVAHNRTEGLRNAAEQARLRELVAPRYEVVQPARSWRGTAFTLVELIARDGRSERDERLVHASAQREATSISTASMASGAPQSSSDAGVATE